MKEFGWTIHYQKIAGCERASFWMIISIRDSRISVTTGDEERTVTVQPWLIAIPFPVLEARFKAKIYERTYNQQDQAQSAHQRDQRKLTGRKKPTHFEAFYLQETVKQKLRERVFITSF